MNNDIGSPDEMAIGFFAVLMLIIALWVAINTYVKKMNEYSEPPPRFYLLLAFALFGAIAFLLKLLVDTGLTLFFFGMYIPIIASMIIHAIKTDKKRIVFKYACIITYIMAMGFYLFILLVLYR